MELPNQASIILGLPFCGRLITPEWVTAMLCQSYPISTSVTAMPIRGLEIGEARNMVVEEALATGARYIWFVDDDTAPPKGAIGILKYIMENGSDEVAAVGGIYCSKSEVPEPLVFRGRNQGVFWRWRVGETFDVDAIATGCLLIRTDIFGKLEKPWFKTNDITGETDDMYFCQKVRDAGYRIKAAGAVLCDHFSNDGKIVYRLPGDSYPMKNAVDSTQYAAVTGK